MLSYQVGPKLPCGMYAQVSNKLPWPRLCYIFVCAQASEASLCWIFGQDWVAQASLDEARLRRISEPWTLTYVVTSSGVHMYIGPLGSSKRAGPSLYLHGHLCASVCPSLCSSLGGSIKTWCRAAAGQPRLLRQLGAGAIGTCNLLRLLQGLIISATPH